MKNNNNNKTKQNNKITLRISRDKPSNEEEIWYIKQIARIIKV